MYVVISTTFSNKVIKYSKMGVPCIRNNTLLYTYLFSHPCAPSTEEASSAVDMLQKSFPSLVLRGYRTTMEESSSCLMRITLYV